MSILRCPRCCISVMPKRDGTCPGCGKPISGDQVEIAEVTESVSKGDSRRHRTIWAIAFVGVIVAAVAAGIVWRFRIGDDTVKSLAENFERSHPQADGKSEMSPDDCVVDVLVINVDREPVANAKVWIFLTLDPRLEDKRHTQGTTANDGTVSLSFPRAWLDEKEGPVTRDLWVVHDGFGVTAQSLQAQDTSKGLRFNVILQKSAPRVLRILSPRDEPVQATVSLESVFPSSVGVMSHLPADVRREVATFSNSDGVVSLASFPRDSRASLRIESAEYGVQTFDAHEMGNEIRLKPVGRIEGFLKAERPDWISDVPMTLFTHSDGESKAEGEAFVISEKDGKFSIPAIAAGRLSFRFSIPREWPVRPIHEENLQVVPGEVTTVEIRMEKTVRLQGSLQVDGRPIPGARTVVVHGVDQEIYEVTTADNDGRFEVQVLPGKVHFSAACTDGKLNYKAKLWKALDIIVPSDSRTFKAQPLEFVLVQ